MKAALFAVFLAFAGQSHAAEAIAAVATNFVRTAETLAAQFERQSGHSVTISSGSTGILYAQIVRGAPYDVFLSADAARPELLEAEGLSVPGSRFAYATGRLALWSPDADLITGPLSLSSDPPRRFAIANPDLAPYGHAAEEVIARLGWDAALQDRIVRGENVGQAFAIVATGNAELGLVSLSAILTQPPEKQGSHWLVPPNLHSPIRQEAVLTRKGASNAAAKAFLEFLKSDKARAHIIADGYNTR